MQKHPDRAITPEEAYSQLYTALLALQKVHGTDFMTGPNDAEKVMHRARVSLHSLQVELVKLIDG